MFLHPRSKNRPFHLGPFPLESLPRDDTGTIAEKESQQPANKKFSDNNSKTNLLSAAVSRYQAIFAQLDDKPPAAEKAPLPDDLQRRSADIKGAAYFMDASQVGICQLPQSAWFSDVESLAHQHNYAIAILVEYGRVPETTNLAHSWIAGAEHITANMRATEIAACVAGHIRNMGFNAKTHKDSSLLDLDRIAVLAGLAVRIDDKLLSPFVDDRYVVAVVSTDYPLACDQPLAADALKASGLRYWWGINGAQSGRERKRRQKRPSHTSIYPMETVKRVDRPTTLIIDDEVPRVPKRAAFFERAVRGDLGAKSAKERTRFAFKTPLSNSQLGLIRALVPFQDGPVAETADGRYDNPQANAEAIKALSYFLGSDLTGICEIPRYAWFSHKEDGKEIQPYHRYAVVMLVDQGYDTMEGASGDDWMSGAQSMRSYLRGAEIAGVMAELLRGLGFPARSQTNADSDVLHIPLVLWAGLGELSRIGELVLNPFVGPRFKSVVLTTDMPLAVDKPIDFGLQHFCNNCLKCARECPCDAIPWGDKVMFNGYEMWKPDVERCTRYRLTNSKGSACGRCMKTCPLNKVVDSDGAILTRTASWLGVNAMWLKPLMVPIATWLDDKLGNGKRNLVKKWWFDHEFSDGKTIAAKATNQRDIDPSRKINAEKLRFAYYNANMMPPPDAKEPVLLDRKAALAAKEVLETPDQARARIRRKGEMPLHYRPTPTISSSDIISD